MQTALPIILDEDRESASRRAFARLWLGCRDVARKKRYRVDVTEERWKQIEKEARS